MGEMGQITETTETPPKAMRIPVEAYISSDYARAERDRLWRKVWLQAGRVEDVPEIGNYITYEQDFSNMAAVQQGMKTVGFRGNIPNPKAEGAVVSLHRNLARYMGTGAPVPIARRPG